MREELNPKDFISSSPGETSASARSNKPSQKVNRRSISKHHIQPGYFDSTLAGEIQSIPSRISFKIGEVAELLNIKTHVLRYWEMEFESFHPQKMSNGQRLYFKKDVETALLIKKLLYRDGFSVKGAKKALKDLKRENQQYRKKSAFVNKMLKKINRMQETISVIRELIK